MNDLIARLEKASGPDQELDIEIFEAVAGPTQRTDRRGVMKVPVLGYDEVYMRRKCHAYTASIDAALTLVPPSMEWEIGSANLANKYWARVLNHNFEVIANGRTAASALGGAALKARAAIAKATGSAS